MNNDQLLSFVRQFLTLFGTALGTWLVSKGYLKADDLKTLGGASVTVGGVILSVAPIAIAFYNSLRAHSAEGRLKSVASIPDVAAVRMAPTQEGIKLADAVPSSKVTT